MPRQDVPYGGAICRLKERIAEIWDKLGEKLHSINGVEGDAAGDVKIVSADPAVIITNNAASHEIEIGLDSLELPSAAVQSVNGETGAVALTADDIPSDNGDVQTDLDALGLRVTANGTAISNEVTDRQNADSALQGNINTVQASIPAAAAAAVANDPTVTQLATDVPNKLDKITSGSTLKAYTHTGANQGETSVVDGTAANSIGIRDADGRMQAADPASGATDKTLTTANWISQTGDSAPNNLVHKNGNETIKDVKTYQYQPTRAKGISQSAGSGWFKIWESEESVGSIRRTTILNLLFREQAQFGKFIISRRLLNQTTVTALYSTLSPTSIIVTRDGNGKMILWAATTRTTAWIEIETLGNITAEQELSNVLSDNTIYPQPDAADYEWMVTI